MPTLTETTGHAGGFMVSEARGARSREAIVVAESQTLKAGAVLGKVALGAVPSAVAGGGNTGDGTVTGVDDAPNTQIGAYTLRCHTAAANGGEFEVTDPNGDRLEDAQVGVAYSGDQLDFTINDGATDFAVGDTFTITFVAGLGQYVELDPAAEDGSQKAAAILWDDVTTVAAETADATVVVRDAEVNAAEIVWPTGITTDQKNTALAELAAAGVIAR